MTDNEQSSRCQPTCAAKAEPAEAGKKDRP